jgi:hypothetical protein
MSLVFTRVQVLRIRLLIVASVRGVLSSFSLFPGNWASNLGSFDFKLPGNVTASIELLTSVRLGSAVFSARFRSLLGLWHFTDLAERLVAHYQVSPKLGNSSRCTVGV